jgi:hypothetical protein
MTEKAVAESVLRVTHLVTQAIRKRLHAENLNKQSPR